MLTKTVWRGGRPNGHGNFKRAKLPSGLAIETPGGPSYLQGVEDSLVDGEVEAQQWPRVPGLPLPPLEEGAAVVVQDQAERVA
eukprot:scaffold91322_cov28-Prasinocladus_malaysianus.AAC.1